MSSAQQHVGVRSSVNAFMRRRATVPALSFFAVFGFVGGSLVNPLQADIASAAVTAPTIAKAPAPQQYTAHGTYADFDMTRDGYKVTAKVVQKATTTSVAAATTTTSTDTSSSASTTTTDTTSSSSDTTTTTTTTATGDGSSAQTIAASMVTARGWGSDQFSCLVSLWNKESGWNVYAYNSSGAYGIPQALPGSKMASVGSDWQTNPATQITWGLNYISGVYGTPCAAWAHSESSNWY